MRENRSIMHDGMPSRDGGRVELKTKIERDVWAVLSDVLGTPLADITRDSELEADLGMNSLKMIETNVALEVKFGFVSPDIARPEELRIRTVDDLVGYVADRVLEQVDRQ